MPTGSVTRCVGELEEVKSVHPSIQVQPQFSVGRSLSGLSSQSAVALTPLALESLTQRFDTRDVVLHHSSAVDIPTCFPPQFQNFSPEPSDVLTCP